MDEGVKKESLKKEILQTLTDINAILTSVDRLMCDLQRETDLGSSLAVAGNTATKSFEGLSFTFAGNNCPAPDA